MACTLITTAAAYGFSVTQSTAYTATASLLFRSSTLDQQVSGTNYFAPAIDPSRAASTDLTLVSLGTISALTAQALHNGITSADVQSRVSVTSAGQSDVISVAATDASPRLAAVLANTYAQQYVTFSASSDRRKVSEAQAMVQRQFNALAPRVQSSPQGQSLANHAEQLSILAHLQTGNAELVQAASVPSAPSSPQPRRDALIGVVLGLLLGLILAVLAQRRDRGLHSVDELAAVYELPLLGVIPRDPYLASPPPEPGPAHSESAESFQLLRSRLRYFNVDRAIRTILVTSSGSAEGKTTIVWNLAVAIARAGHSRTLVIEADLRRPTLAERLDLVGSPGLAEMITRAATASDAIQAVTIDGQQVTPAPTSTNGNARAHHVDVLLAGSIPPNPTELLESAEMRRVLTLLQKMYDHVIIDTAPMAMVSDAIPLIPFVDGLVVVSRLGKESRDAARHMRTHLRQVAAPTLGVVANDVKSSADGYYGYAYVSDRRPAESVVSAETRSDVLARVDGAP